MPARALPWLGLHGPGRGDPAGGRVEDDLPNPESWNIRVDNKTAISLSHLLAHEEAWLTAIAALRDRLLELQRARESS